MKHTIPPKRQEDVLYMLWIVATSLESRADGDPNAVLDRGAVTSAYSVLNDVGYTDLRPAWEMRAAELARAKASPVLDDPSRPL